MMQNEFEDQFRGVDRPPLEADFPRAGSWDFGRAVLFYLFLTGATIVIGGLLFLALGFKVSALVTEAALYLALPYFMSRYLDTGWSSWMRWPRPTLRGWSAVVLTILSLGVLVSNLPVAVDRFYPMSEQYKQIFEQFLQADSTGELLLLFLVAALIPGICEEVAFRGLIQGGIRVTYGSRVAVLVTGILFALIHMSPWNFPALLIMGWFLGMLRERTGSIWPGAVAHTLNNAAALLLVTIAPPVDHDWQYDFMPWWMNLTAAFIFVVSMIIFIKSGAHWQEPAGQEEELEVV